MKPVNLQELRAFAAVIKHGSFTRGAASLGVSPPSLSQTVRNFEARLGLRLLNRSTRSVSVTPEGARLAEQLLPVLTDLDRLFEDLLDRDPAPSGLLRINTSRTALPTLAPIVPLFLTAYPRISLDIEVSDRLTDIVRDGFDAGIRIGERLEVDMTAVRFGPDLRMAVVGSPAYFTEHPIPVHPRDLQQHHCLTLRSPTDGSPYRWEFEYDGVEIKVPVNGPLTCNDPTIRLATVAAGRGLAYMFEYQVAALIEEGRLQRVLTDWTPPFPGCFLYYPSRQNQRPALRAFIEFVLRSR